MFRLSLYLHIMGAIIAFGPSFTFPILGRYMAREPQHRNFTLRAIETIHLRMMFPVALTMLVSGAGLIYFGQVDLAQPWLIASLVIYFLALGVGLFLQGPAMSRLIEISSRPMPVGPGAATAIAPELKRELHGLRLRTQVGRNILALSLFTIAALMIWRPGGTV
ncbi:MAG TPA: DUF2269 family protein [Candidatus Dormibacteraeota bacterium]|jgi:uncharacterized membrane protein